MIDWAVFLDERGIEYVTTGPNVAKGNLNVRCPLCSDDPSHHMGISLQGKGWACWRSKLHRGRSEARLVALLLSISMEEARHIVFGGTTIPGDGIHDLVKARLIADDKVVITKSRKLRLPDNFKRFGKLPSSRSYYQYMKRRYYNEYQVREISDYYDVRYCNSGPFKGRIIFPVYQGGELATWTGRSVYLGAKVRYKTLTADLEKAKEEGTQVAREVTTALILWYDLLVESPGQKLIVVEGPFDALRVDYLGRIMGIRSTSLFGKSVYPAQMQLLYELVQYYPERYLLLDQEASADALRMQIELSSLHFRIKQLPPSIKDPADISKRQLLDLLD